MGDPDDSVGFIIVFGFIILLSLVIRKYIQNKKMKFLVRLEEERRIQGKLCLCNNKYLCSASVINVLWLWCNYSSDNVSY